MQIGWFFPARGFIAASTVLWACAITGAQPAQHTQGTGPSPTVDRFELGQRWEYDHQGPRPGAMKPTPVDGHRILQVMSRSEQDGPCLWVVEERFTQDPNAVGRLSVDNGGWLRSLDIANEKGEVARLTYDSAVAYQDLELEVDEQKTQTTTLRSADGKLTMPMTLELRRLADEDVVTKAGRFEACRRFEVVTRSVLDLKFAKIPLQEKRQRWYSDAVHGLVKEVYQREPGKFLTWSWEGYTATSTLLRFGIEEVTAEVPIMNPSPIPPGMEEPMLRRPLIRVLVILSVGLCFVLGYRVIKRA